jgi:Zn-dependent protease
LINLLPIYPLDGGQISRDLLTRLNPQGGLRMSLGISLLVAGFIAINSVLASNGRPLLSFLPSGMFISLMFGLLAVQSFLQLQQQRIYDPNDPWLGEGRPWERQD